MIQYFTSKKKSGFTLIELLVVIAIIGVLATIVLVSLNTARKKSRDVRRESDLRQMNLALEMFFDDYGCYPDEGTNAALDSTDACNGNSFGTNYLNAIPTDPKDGSAYTYESDTTTYCIDTVQLESKSGKIFKCTPNGCLEVASTDTCPDL